MPKKKKLTVKTSNLVGFSRTQLALAVSACLYCLTTQAASDSTVRPYVEYTYSHDNNLFRLPVDTAGQPNNADSFQREDIGILVDKTISRQHISGYWDISHTTYNKFTELNHTANDALAQWDWQLGNHIDGLLALTYNQDLAPFTELRSSAKNIKTQKNAVLEGNWTFHPSWRLHSGVAHQTIAYDLPDAQIGNRTEFSQEVGIDYQPATNSSVGIRYRHAQDTYEKSQPLGNIVINNNYIQDELKLRADWRVSGKTQILFYGGVVRRAYNDLQSRNKTTPSARLTANWKATGKTTVSAALYHEISPSDDLTVNYTVNKGAALNVDWEATRKIKVAAILKIENRDFNAATNFAGSLQENRQEKYHYTALNLAYTPVENIKVKTGVYRETLGSSLSQRSYKATGVFISLRANF